MLQEFYHQSTRPSRQAAITHEQALNFLRSLESFPIQPVTLDIFRSAVAIRQRFGLSYWDGAILAAARALGCDAVYSEDLSSEQDLRRPAGHQPLRGCYTVGPLAARRPLLVVRPRLRGRGPGT